MNYALIEDGIVTNIIWLSYSNAGEFPNAYPYGNILVAIGDTFKDGEFYRDGERVLSTSEILDQQVTELQQALLILGITPEDGMM